MIGCFKVAFPADDFKNAQGLYFEQLESLPVTHEWIIHRRPFEPAPARLRRFKRVESPHGFAWQEVET